MVEQKYRVIRRLEAGGMAEVYLAEAVSMQGFKKTVAIKRVLPHLAQNEAFIQMFLDEARLSARLDHANIVSVFDISQREDTYFLVMEFVDGANLKKTVESMRKRGQRIGLGQAVYLCIEACRGLSYAHELKDEHGAPLGIVHRDISPPNILLTRRGEVKLADFGLAKASTQLQTTDPGVVKGKFSYLSPEAADGKEVDLRADIFSMGIVLWELLAGKRLFLGENDYATVKLVQRANIPRLAPLNREVDEGFEEILLKALARDPARRYQSAREFGDTLAGYLFNRQLKVTAFDLANLVELAIGDDSGAERAQPGSLIDRLIQDELDASVKIDGSGAQQLGSLRPSSDGGALEDPASWFNEADLRSVPPGALQPVKAKGKGERPQDSDRPSGTWREAGLHEPSPEPRARIDDSGIAELGPALEPDEASGARRPPLDPDAVAVAGGAAMAQPKSNAGKVVVFALLAVAALAVMAWLGARM